MRNKYSVFLFLALTGFAFGLYNPVKKLTVLRTPSSVALLSVNDYANLPCPSPADGQRLVEMAHLDTEGQEISCSSDHMAKILKLLYFAEKLKIDIPKSWGGVHSEAISSPLTYITQKTPELEIDLHQLTKVASNNIKKKIYIGAQFFEVPPLKALEVLIHENHHSESFDPGHARCRTGDIPKAAGGCDESFSLSNTAGAYSKGTFFNIGLALYAQNLSEDDRKFLLNSALAVISTRFNIVPESLAVPLDLIYVLKNDNKIYQVHPFTSELIPIDVTATIGNQVITKIQYDPVSQGLVFFTNHGKIYSFDSHHKMQNYYSELIDKNLFYTDSTKLYISTGPMGEYAYTFFSTKEGDLFFKEIEVQSGKAIFVKYKKRPAFITKKLLTAKMFSSFLLSEEGTLHEIQVGGRTGLLQPYKEYSSFQVPENKWLDVTGGATYDELIGVADDGKVYYETAASKGSKTLNSDFVTDTPLIKYQEGLNIKVALSDSEELYVWDYARSTGKPWRLPLEGLKDVAVARSYATNDHLVPHRRKATEWSKNCKIEDLYFEPWTGKYLGVDDHGALIFTGSSDQPCVKFQNSNTFEPSPVMISGSEIYSDFNSFSQTFLMLQKTDQEYVKLSPYHLP